MTHITDVLVIGAGPVGLFAIFECGMLRLKCHVIDALDMIGGQCAALYPEKPIYDIPAHPMITGADLIDHLRQQIEPFHPEFHLGQRVVDIAPMESTESEPTTPCGWRVITSAGTTIDAKVIIIAAGVGAFGPNRPPLENIESYEDSGCIQYYVRSREAFRDRSVVIAGGGDSAVDWAISLQEIARSVHVVHRRAKFRAAPESEARLAQMAKDGHIHLVVPYQLHGLKGENGILSHVVVESMTGERKEIKADILLPFFGLSMNLGPIAEWGLGLEKNHISVEPSTASTNRPGIYAIGDVATYPHKLKLILTGFAEAAQAAYSIRRFLYPDEVLHFEYSTTNAPGAR